MVPSTKYLCMGSYRFIVSEIRRVALSALGPCLQLRAEGSRVLFYGQCDGAGPHRGGPALSIRILATEISSRSERMVSCNLLIFCNLQSPIPTRISGHAVTTSVRLNAAVLCDGINTTGYQSACYFYSNDSWSPHLSLNVARASHGMAWYMNSIYVYGGKNASGPLDSIEVLSKGAEAWKLLPYGL